MLPLAVVAPVVVYGAIAVSGLALGDVGLRPAMVGPFPGWEVVELQVLPGDVVVVVAGDGTGGAYLVTPSARGAVGAGVVSLPAGHSLGVIGCGVRAAVLSSSPPAGLPFRRTGGLVVAATRPPGLWGDVLCQLQVGFGR